MSHHNRKLNHCTGDGTGRRKKKHRRENYQSFDISDDRWVDSDPSCAVQFERLMPIIEARFLSAPTVCQILVALALGPLISYSTVTPRVGMLSRVLGGRCQAS